MNHLVKNVNEDFVSDWLQAGNAVVTVGCAEKKDKFIVVNTQG